jgi:hypothetical protein
MKDRFLIVLLLSFVLLLTSCQPTTTYYLGATADRESVVRLSTLQGEQQRWQDTYVTIDYTIKQQGGSLALDGNFAFSISPQINFTRVRDFKVRFFQLDKDLRVVNYQEIVRTLSTNPDDEVTFSYNLKVPGNVVAVTFGYDGFFIDGEEGTTFAVRKYPRKNP